MTFPLHYNWMKKHAMHLIHKQLNHGSTSWPPSAGALQTTSYTVKQMTTMFTHIIGVGKLSNCII